jgi:hypothetical protein
MPSLIVQFDGICTHILPPYAPDPVPHLVVIPHDERAVPHVQKHVPYLWIRRGTAVPEEIEAFAVEEAGLRYEGLFDEYHKIRLEGVRFEIVNPDGTDAYSLDRTFVCGLPRLTPQAGYLLHLDEEVVRGRKPEVVDAFFDVSSGRFSAKLLYTTRTADLPPDRPAAAILNALTDGEPTLRATAIVGGDSRDLTLRSASRIWIENIAAGVDADDDFALHYIVVTNPPDKPAIPGEARCLAGLFAPPRNPRQSLGPGCANSTFP